MNRAHRLADQVRSVVGWLQASSSSAAAGGASTASQFVTKGFLSPAEFVEAGDQLIWQTPTWQWQSCDANHQVFWLPPSKQYLITRNIPCRYRIHDWEKCLIKGTTMTNEGWFMTGQMEAGSAAVSPPRRETSLDEENDASLIKNLSSSSDLCATSVVVRNFVDDELEEDYVDLGQPAGGQSTCSTTPTVQSRTYDLSITYDKYYQSPRLWLFGYDEAGVPLVAESVFEDIHNDYLAKTVTVDPHPFTGVPTVSIHPCKHAAVMRTVAQNWVKAGMTPRHDLALFILLKMVSSVVPTINYDFTIDVEMPMDNL